MILESTPPLVLAPASFVMRDRSHRVALRRAPLAMPESHRAFRRQSAMLASWGNMRVLARRRALRALAAITL